MPRKKKKFEELTDKEKDKWLRIYIDLCEEDIVHFSRQIRRLSLLIEQKKQSIEKHIQLRMKLKYGR